MVGLTVAGSSKLFVWRLLVEGGWTLLCQWFGSWLRRHNLDVKTSLGGLLSADHLVMSSKKSRKCDKFCNSLTYVGYNFQGSSPEFSANNVQLSPFHQIPPHSGQDCPNSNGKKSPVWRSCNYRFRALRFDAFVSPRIEVCLTASFRASKRCGPCFPVSWERRFALLTGQWSEY